MPTATLTTKGQFTLPKPIREALNLSAGDRIEVTLEDGAAVIKPATKSIDSVFGFLAEDNEITLTTEQMDEAIAKHFKS